jgi:hypothetical protein
VKVLLPCFWIGDFIKLHQCEEKYRFIALGVNEMHYQVEGFTVDILLHEVAGAV